MGVGVTCPKCNISFAFYCSRCSSYDAEINKGFEPEKYFVSRSINYLKCKQCLSEFDYVECPVCDTKIIPTAPFVKGDVGGEKATGCFIATACLSDKSQILKQLYLFRDEFLEKNSTGKKFIKYYYRYSPALASRIYKNNLLQSITKLLLVYPVYYVSLLVMKIVSFNNK